MDNAPTFCAAAHDAAELTRAIRALLPPGVAVSVECFDPKEEVPTETARSVAGAIRARRAEFAAGRRSAQAALLSLGLEAGDIPRGPLGQPIWPENCGGSISHDGTLAAAIAFARGTPWRCAGLDIMLAQTIKSRDFSDLAEIVLTSEERIETPTTSQRTLSTFMLKEAAIKIVSPVLGRLVDFLEIRLSTIGPGMFQATAPGGLKIYLRNGACRIGSAAIAWL